MSPIVVLLMVLFAAGESALPRKAGWEEAGRVESKFAHQAAAADETSVYAVSSTTVARHDRTTGKLLSSGTAPSVKHLNSAFVHAGKVYCAHSNYPKKPEESDIRVFDPATAELAVHHKFVEPPGSIVWCVRDGKRWWCCFAHYGADNAMTVLVRFEDGWKESGRWTFPKKVVDDWDAMSASGGIFFEGSLLVTHHHFKVLYRLKVPDEPGELQFTDALASPFPGQGIAVDPKTGGLVGIDRSKRSVVFAVKSK